MDGFHTSLFDIGYITILFWPWGYASTGISSFDHLNSLSSFALQFRTSKFRDFEKKTQKKSLQLFEKLLVLFFFSPARAMKQHGNSPSFGSVFPNFLPPKKMTETTTTNSKNNVNLHSNSQDKMDGYGLFGEKHLPLKVFSNVGFHF